MAYKYSDHIKGPNKFFGHRAKDMERNLKNMFVYMDLLTDPKSKASGGDTLGDRYFVKTIGTCKVGDEEKDRYMWIDNEVRDDGDGLLTSMVNTLNDLNVNISADTPDCKCVKGRTRDNKHEQKWQSRYISADEFEETSVLEESTDCEAFQNMGSADFPKDPMHKMYLTSITLLGAYILFLLYSKRS